MEKNDMHLLRTSILEDCPVCGAAARSMCDQQFQGDIEFLEFTIKCDIQRLESIDARHPFVMAIRALELGTDLH
jgi:hypothetical protein